MSTPPVSEEEGGTELSAEADASQEEKARPVRKRRRVFGEKVCGVCGDKALAHHFGALACETCKAFFRRNATSKESRKCSFQGSCEISIKTRRFCPACRLRKCFEAGMRADLILDEEEKKQRMWKVKKKQFKEEPQTMSAESDSTIVHSPVCTISTTGLDIATDLEVTSPDVTRCPQRPAGLSETLRWQSVAKMVSGDRTVMTSSGHQSNTTAMPVVMMKSSEGSSSGIQWNSAAMPVEVGQSFEIVLSNADSLTEETKMMVYSGQGSLLPPSAIDLSTPSTPPTPAVSHLPDHWRQQQQASPSPSPTPTTSTPETPQGFESLPAPSASLVAQAQLLSSFQHVPREALPSDPYMYWRLSEEERCLLTQLSAAYQDTLLSILQGSPPRDFVRSECVTAEAYLQECEMEARNAVSFAKRMEDFRQLRTDEQIALLKASTRQVLGIRSCALYIMEKNAWLTRMGYFTLEHVLKLVPNHPHKDLSVSFCRSIKSIVKNDVTLYALLHCVVLFDPCDERVIDRQLINSIRDKYIILLRHYLQSVFSFSHSEKYMLALQGNLIFYRNLCQEAKPLIKKFFPSIPNKLLVELMDLD